MLSFDRPPSIIGRSGENLRHSGSVPKWNWKNNFIFVKEPAQAKDLNTKKLTFNGGVKYVRSGEATEVREEADCN